MNSAQKPSSGKSPRSTRWPMTAATIGVLPPWWIVHTLTDPTPRFGWLTADVWFGFLMMLQPWLIL